MLSFSGIGLRKISINKVSYIWYISVGHDSTIYYTDVAGNLYFIKDERDVKIITSPRTGYNLGKIVMDTSGNVYSPDRKSNCVYKLSSDLKLNKIITDSEFFDINAICINKNCSKFFVANNRGRSIIVFNCT